MDKLDHEHDILLAQMKLEADMQAAQAGIDENRKNARRKMLEKLSKQRQVAKARASDLKEKQNAFIKAQDGMTEVAKQSAIKKLNEMERRQQAMENEIEDGLKKFEQDISKFRDQTKNEQDMKRSMLKQKLEAKRQQKEALALKEQELAKRIQQQEANIDEQRRREIELELQSAQRSAMHWKDRFKANRKLMRWSRKEFVLTLRINKVGNETECWKNLKKSDELRLQRRKRMEAEEAALKEQAMKHAKLEKERLEREGHNTEEVVASLQTRLESNLLQHRAQQDSKKQERKRRMQERLKAKEQRKL